MRGRDYLVEIAPTSPREVTSESTTRQVNMDRYAHSTSPPTRRLNTCSREGPLQSHCTSLSSISPMLFIDILVSTPPPLLHCTLGWTYTSWQYYYKVTWHDTDDKINRFRRLRMHQQTNIIFMMTPITTHVVLTKLVCARWASSGLGKTSALIYDRVL
jgi:hypothetical protein